MFTRLVAAFLLVLSASAACSAQKPDDSGEITGEAPAVGDDAETSAEETTVDPASLLTLENRDFNGAEFTIAYIN